ncbi:hypothetical protein BDA96_02G437100 [Sorghum bicolor]|uniref:Uncharacterized protein n=2 Tax=Sorghum bicolor TaxID=4558 RepID=A0A1W0W800_SORBI|nr:hypothetical protein BDA96_02G437100 [Sorghum bicolor]OQU90471.1 hypothetical protein SORBI_3002G417101 [Sorghum bicolor]
MAYRDSNSRLRTGVHVSAARVPVICERVDLVNVGTYWLSNKKNCVLNIISSAVIWSVWKLRNDICFQRIGWRGMEMLLGRIVGLLLSWMVICPVDMKDSLKECIDKIKTAASRVLWLPFVSSQVTT